jgi:hypothetical protein
MKVGNDHHVPPSACTNCGIVMDGATGVAEDDHKGDIVPDAGVFTVCIECGHIMIFADDLTVRNLTANEMIEVAGDKRLIAIQQARAIAQLDRAYCEDFVREQIKHMNRKLPSQEMINHVVDNVLAAVPKLRRPA